MIGILRKSGLVIIGVYLIGWIIALIGLGLGQDWCKDHLFLLDQASPDGSGLPVYTLLAHETGKNCRTLYRCAPRRAWLNQLSMRVLARSLARPEHGNANSATSCTLRCLQRQART